MKRLSRQLGHVLAGNGKKSKRDYEQAESSLCKVLPNVSDGNNINEQNENDFSPNSLVDQPMEEGVEVEHENKEEKSYLSGSEVDQSTVDDFGYTPNSSDSTQTQETQTYQSQIYKVEKIKTIDANPTLSMSSSRGINDEIEKIQFFILNDFEKYYENWKDLNGKIDVVLRNGKRTKLLHIAINEKNKELCRSETSSNNMDCDIPHFKSLFGNPDCVNFLEKCFYAKEMNKRQLLISALIVDRTMNGNCVFCPSSQLQPHVAYILFSLSLVRGHICIVSKNKQFIEGMSEKMKGKGIESCVWISGKTKKFNEDSLNGIRVIFIDLSDVQIVDVEIIKAMTELYKLKKMALLIFNEIDSFFPDSCYEPEQALNGALEIKKSCPNVTTLFHSSSAISNGTLKSEIQLKMNIPRMEVVNGNYQKKPFSNLSIKTNPVTNQPYTNKMATKIFEESKTKSGLVICNKIKPDVMKESIEETAKRKGKCPINVEIYKPGDKDCEKILSRWANGTTNTLIVNEVTKKLGCYAKKHKKMFIITTDLPDNMEHCLRDINTVSGNLERNWILYYGSKDELGEFRELIECNGCKKHKIYERCGYEDDAFDKCGRCDECQRTKTEERKAKKEQQEKTQTKITKFSKKCDEYQQTKIKERYERKIKKEQQEKRQTKITEFLKPK